ncbi:DinB family protein [Silvibacterium dinghuense]|uniref:DinB family protein n=1 Tax=Silvibacterium dinghuense TaxID=1560006 RepID=A0A4Q1SEE9_9BACT|nr:DinB family protein [Silvibacterium dinghuense]RXS95497.1 DinB family protein [Silvibacterium dinghuense]GGH13596.1 hypothetical protein GCM10011586_33560 [Silvibacterium dinghuense]
MSSIADRSSIPAWFERRFDFAFPVSLLPNLRMRLHGTPARLEEVLRGVSREALVRKPEGKWSAQEQAGHLLQLEPLWLARVHDYARDSVNLTPTDLANAATDLADYNSWPLEEILAGFRSARMALFDAVEALDPALAAHTLPHPRLKTPFRLVDHLFFVAEHDDHHLAHIWELLHRKPQP